MFFVGIYNTDIFEDKSKYKILKILVCGLVLYLFLYLLSESEFGSKIMPLQQIKLYFAYLFFLDLCGVLVLNRINRFANYDPKKNINYRSQIINRPNLAPVYKDIIKQPILKQPKQAKQIKPKKEKVEKIEDSQSSIYIETYKPTKEFDQDIEIPVYKSSKK
ncbi:MAG: hypothetical protein CMF62_02910 [Magnetococcales bacterium]|nr:hypothetical protein [Magnetococcales bacterium]|tara:strand:- start:4764 stop:5249 length:486 start_codon:yes stop_codon:yes gene_type:complete